MCFPVKPSPQARADQSKSTGKGQSKDSGNGNSKGQCKGNGKEQSKGKENGQSKGQGKGKDNGQSKGQEENERQTTHKHEQKHTQKHVHKHKRSAKTKSQSKVLRITHWGIPLTVWPRFLMRPPVTGKHLAKATTRDSSGTKCFSKLYLYSHTPEQILAAILSAPSRSSAKTRAKAIKRYHELLSRPDQKPEDADLLFKYFKAFDQIFSHGVLTGLCYVHVVKKLADAIGDCCTVRTEELSDFKYRYEAQIRILDLCGHSEYGQSREERLHKYLATLLHECVHAVLVLYTCMIYGSCRERERRVVGRDGHLSVWQEIAHGIEAATEEVLGRRFDLSRTIGLGGDLAASRKLKMPTKEQLARWSLNPRELMREIRARR